MAGEVDLKKEQEATLARPLRAYGAVSRLLFLALDLLYGKKLSYGKIRALEILAPIPYQTWEVRQYDERSRRVSNPSAVESATDIIAWSREAQDNEFWHLQVVDAKMRQDGMKLHWLRDVFAPSLAAFKYRIFSRVLAFFSIKAAFRMNADFEDHAEHEYMIFVRDHPELDNQAVNGVLVSTSGDLRTWGDVFRQIGLDERHHMQDSLSRSDARK